MNVIPIFIIVHNQYDCLKKSVASYEKFIKTPIDIIFHNVASTYYETLDYLKEKKLQGYKVYNTNINNHHTVINSVKDYISKHPECKYCVITDPDIELFNVNEDILELYIHSLHKFKKTSVGPMLEINDIPDYYPRKKAAINGHKQQFWNKKRETVIFNNNRYEFINSNTDTTFHLFSVKNLPKNWPHGNSIRFLSPYSARHLDWYINPNNITPCQLYYKMNTTNISHWNNSNWKGSYRGERINELTNSSSIKYIFYYNSVKIENIFNFGDYITEYIFKKLTNKTPILDINGGKHNDNVVFGAGSILSFSKKNSIIWGTGFIKTGQTLVKPKKILSVRGPLTRKRLLKLGHICPENYGDIGLIMPYVYNPLVKKKYRLGIIPHYIDIKKFNTLYPNYDEDVKIIDVRNPVEEVIKNIIECEMTMSSTLHGIILSHAYNIKCMWIRISDKIMGGNFKYRDYYGSININDFNNILPYILNKKISTNENIKLINKYPNPVFPIKTKHILELCPFIQIKSTNLLSTPNEIKEMKYISLGFNCNVALALRTCNLNVESNVFDWLVSHPKDILNIFKNNITEFLKEDIIFLNFNMLKQKYYITENKKIKRIYDKNTNLIFSHDYDGTHQSIIITKNKYKRRLIRLNNILTENNKVLFIFSGKTAHKDYINNSHSILSLENKTESKEYFLYLQEISNYLKRSFPVLNFHILAFNLYNKFEDFETDNFSYKYLGDCDERVYLEKKVTKFLMKIKNKKLEQTFNNLNKFITV